MQNLERVANLVPGRTWGKAALSRSTHIWRTLCTGGVWAGKTGQNSLIELLNYFFIIKKWAAKRLIKYTDLPWKQSLWWTVEWCDWLCHDIGRLDQADQMHQLKLFIYFEEPQLCFFVTFPSAILDLSSIDLPFLICYPISLWNHFDVGGLVVAKRAKQTPTAVSCCFLTAQEAQAIHNCTVYPPWFSWDCMQGDSKN